MLKLERTKLVDQLKQKDELIRKLEVGEFASVCSDYMSFFFFCQSCCCCCWRTLLDCSATSHFSCRPRTRVCRRPRVAFA